MSREPNAPTILGLASGAVEPKPPGTVARFPNPRVYASGFVGPQWAAVATQRGWMTTPVHGAPRTPSKTVICTAHGAGPEGAPFTTAPAVGAATASDAATVPTMAATVAANRPGRTGPL